jgi:ribosomal protein S27E
MMVSSRTPEGRPNRCPICGHDLHIEPSPSTLDAACPNCGQILWFAPSGGAAPIFDALRLPTDSFAIDLADYVELVPQSVARENLVLPVVKTPDSLVFAVTNPADRETIEKLRFILNRKIRIIQVSAEWLRDQLRKRYGDDTSNAEMH